MLRGNKRSPDQASYATFSESQKAESCVQASVSSSAFNLASTMIGLGTVTIPFAFRETGVLVGILMLASVIFVTNLSYRLIVRCSAASGTYSYKDLGCHSFGSKSGSSWLELCCVFYAICSCIAYVRVFGDYIPPLIGLVSSSFVPSQTLSMVIAMVIIFPMAAMKSLDALKVVSKISLFGTALTVAVVVAQLCHRGPALSVHWIYNTKGGFLSIFKAFPLMSVANTGHHNMLRIYYELEDRTGPGRATKAINYASCICLTLYSLIGIAGYVALGETCPANVLVAYTADEMNPTFFYLVDFARAFLVVVIILTFAKPHFAVRGGLETVFFGGADKVSTLKRTILTLCTCGFTLAVAICVPSIDVAFDISGSTFGLIMVYILPVVFYSCLERPKWSSSLITMYGLLFGITALVLNIMDLSQKLS